MLLKIFVVLKDVPEKIIFERIMDIDADWKIRDILLLLPDDLGSFVGYFSFDGAVEESKLLAIDLADSNVPLNILGMKENEEIIFFI